MAPGLRAALIWTAVALAIAVPLALAAQSPLLAWRDPAYIAAGFAGIAGLALILLQPLLMGDALPGLTGWRGRAYGPLLVLMMGDNAATVRGPAVEGLMALGEGALEALTPAATGRKKALRLGAAEVLTRLPRSMAKLTALTELNLTRNDFKRLPSWVTSLTRLTRLEISANKLKRVGGVVRGNGWRWSLC